MIWFLNHVANPLVRFILRSKLHPLFSRRLILLEVRGRRSGRTLVLPVQFGRDGEAFVVVPAWPERKKWWRNLRKAAPVAYWSRGQRQNGQGRVVTDPEEKVRCLNAYAAGRRHPTKDLNPATAVVVRIEPAP